MKIATIIGARPQFIKAAAVSRAIHKHNLHNLSRITEIVIHTGQHYDDNMSEIFFSELNIPLPAYNLGVHSLSHGAMTGRMLEKIESALQVIQPDAILVYGDTNSTLAATLAAVKMHIPVSHVEAGLRSFNMKMPEEINRIVTDRLATNLFCPTTTAVDNLTLEGITEQVHNVGDVMYDVTLFYAKKAQQQESLSSWNVEKNQFALCTIHREENTDNPLRLKNILSALHEIAGEIPVIFPLHPRTEKMIHKHQLKALLQRLQIIPPVSYLKMLRLEQDAQVILTDSGGIQKEAFFHKTPCITMRDETEWIETLKSGWNILCGAKADKILQGWKDITQQEKHKDIFPYGHGHAAEKIVPLLTGDENGG